MNNIPLRNATKAIGQGIASDCADPSSNHCSLYCLKPLPFHVHRNKKRSALSQDTIYKMLKFMIQYCVLARHTIF